MNEATAKAGIAAVHAFIETFNAQDHERHAETLNYPHVRFANGRISTIENAEVFMAGSRRGEDRLHQEGWHHTTVTNVDVIHPGDDKVHLAPAPYTHLTPPTTYAVQISELAEPVTKTHLPLPTTSAL